MNATKLTAAERRAAKEAKRARNRELYRQRREAERARGKARNEAARVAAENASGPNVTEGAAPMNPAPLPDMQPQQADAQPSDAAETARAAAFGTEEPKPGAQPSDEGAPVGLTADGLIALASMVVASAVEFSAARMRIKAPKELAGLSDSEAAKLRGLAPLALPWINENASKLPPWAGAALFGGALVLVTAQHVAALRDIEPEPPTET